MSRSFITSVRENGSLRVQRDCTVENPRTVQAFREECDVNYILRKYPVQSAMDHFRAYSREYQEIEAGDFHEAVEIQRRAQEMFEELPAQLRHRFHQDPGEFLRFVQDSKNGPELIELGLREPSRASELERIAQATESLVRAAEQPSESAAVE